MVSQPAAFDFDDRDCYPIHEEDDVPEIPRHERQTRELRDAISAHRPEHFLTGNVCIYWERGNTRRYRAPDIMVAAGPPVDDDPRVYLTWRDPEILFVAEIGSRSTFRVDEGPKQEIYGELILAREYLYADPPKNVCRLWRLGAAGYEERAPEANGRLRSTELELEFGIDVDGDLRAYTLDGERLRTYTEAEQELREAEARATAERSLREGLERQLAALQEELRRRDNRADGGDTSI